MGDLSVVQTLWTAQMPVLGQTSWLDITDGGGGPELIIHDPAWQRAHLSLSSALLRPQDARYQSVGHQGARQDLTLERQTRQIDRATIDRLDGDSNSATTYLDGLGFAGNLAALHRATVNGKDFLYVAACHGAGVSTYRIEGDGTLTLVRAIGDSQTRYLGGVTAMDSVWLGGRQVMVTISMAENGLSVFELTGGGQLNTLSSFGVDEQLPVDRPCAVTLVELNGRVFVLLAAFGTSSLTVLALDDTGVLRFVDQVLDTSDTRFDDVLAMDVVTVNGQVLVAVAGGDGGVSVYQVLPGGRLVHRDTLVDTDQTALNGIRQLQFVQLGDRVELFALSTRDAGLTRLLLEVGPAGIAGEELYGTGGNDVLTAGPGGVRLRARNGEDVLIDGAGRDTLYGGEDADLFVFQADGQADTIADFDPAEDRIDLSGFALLHEAADLWITRTGTGAVLRWGQETLHLLRAGGGAIEAAELTSPLLFDSDRVIMPDPLPMTGETGNDSFAWSSQPDTIDGGAGYDTMSYALAPQRVQVDLTDNGRNGGAAAGDLLRNIEAVTGTRYDDVLTGDGAANALTGLQGRDTLNGGAGSDWFTPGAGSDVVQGGSGVDMVSYFDLSQAVGVNLATGRAVSGGETDMLSSIENATGSIHGDVIQGDAGANRLRGIGGYDWFVGSDGSDFYDGGTGRDMISYVLSPTGVTVNLGTGRGSAGQAAGDTYSNMERFTGSVHADLAFGSDGADDFRGLGGYDWFVGSGGGKDRYDGGSGLDTVAYSAAAAGVAASLLLGRGTAGDAARDLYTSIENLTGSSHDDILTGDNGRNRLRGLYGEDTLYGNGGVDRIEGGGSDDFINGGGGWDVAIFSGNRAEYTLGSQGRFTIVDRIAPGGDGTDTLINIEALQFADQMVFL